MVNATLLDRPGAVNSQQTQKPFVVVGGGIAGIAAALRLAECGAPVALLETRQKLGGRATSFDDVRSGERLDNCQHIAMGCCTNYLDLLERLGVADKVAWSRDITWIEPGGRRSVMKPGVFPAPGHFAESFLGARFLTVDEKFAIAAGMHHAAYANLESLTSITFKDWLQRYDQPAGAIDKFWAPVVVSACNLWPERLAASEALHVFQEGFLAHRDAAMIGVPTTPLVELYDTAESIITKAGGTIHLGTSVARIDADEVETVSGEILPAHQVICAVPFERAIQIVSERAQGQDGRFRRLSRLEHSPILGVHLTFDRPVLDVAHAALVGVGTQWLFRKDDEGRKVHAVISGADSWVGLDEATIIERVLDDMRACLPKSEHAELVSGRPVKEKRATFAPTPASTSLRPETTGPSGVILAGDYVDVGWPSTMEGATRSGYLAAAVALGHDDAWALRPSLMPPAPYRAARWAARAFTA